jgi:hypothetical protein
VAQNNSITADMLQVFYERKRLGDKKTWAIPSKGRFLLFILKIFLPALRRPASKSYFHFTSLEQHPVLIGGNRKNAAIAGILMIIYQ